MLYTRRVEELLAGGWALDPRSSVLSRAEATSAASEDAMTAPVHLFAYPLESNFSGARCAFCFLEFMPVSSAKYCLMTALACVTRQVPVRSGTF